MFVPKMVAHLVEQTRWTIIMHILTKLVDTMVGGTSDLGFRKYKGSKRSKSNEKGDQRDRKSGRKFVQIAKKLLNNTFW